jgi:hypothetical protein
MLSKCANPDCSTPFLYLREGKLFRMEIPVDGTSENDAATSAAVRYRVEFFWLCDYCSNRMTLAWKRGQGVRAVPLRQYKAAS